MTRNNGSAHAQAVAAAQSAFHDQAHSYDAGSPHLRHAGVRNVVIRDLTELVKTCMTSFGRCRVLEIGAGHGTFTQTLLDAGATVTVTEASRTSADVLSERYRTDKRVTVLFDASGTDSLALTQSFDLTVCVSVLHHIPDYLKFIENLVAKVDQGGSFYSVQDPCLYSRMPPLTRRIQMTAYFAWRLTQGKYGRGAMTRLRRLRHEYNDSPSDLVEYHVVRDGLDEQAIHALLRPLFEDVELFSYWSTQSAVLQNLGARTAMRTNFGVRASHRTSVEI